MPIDHSLKIRKAIVAHLRTDAAVTALVPSTRIYGEFVATPTGQQPTFPFIRIGYSVASPFEATCWSGSENSLTVHVFAHGPGTDSVETISAAVIKSIRDMDPASIEGWMAEWEGKDVVPDEVPEHLHAILRFSVIAFEVA